MAQGDAGARDLLRSNSHQIEDVLVSDGGIVQDIDQPDDLELGQGKISPRRQLE